MLCFDFVFFNVFTMMPVNKRKRRTPAEVADLRQKLTELKHTGGVTDSALLKIARKIKANPILEGGFTHTQLKQAGAGVFDEVRHIEKLRMQDGTEWMWELCEPNLLLSKLVRHSPRLQARYAAALAQFPCSMARPWSMVIALDEYTPGNALRPNNERKAMNFSYTFRELGQDAWARDEVWCALAFLAFCLQGTATLFL